MIKQLLAAKMLAIWEKDVRPFAPDEHIRWQTLLESLPDDISPEMLRDALAPLAAKSDKEQALFGEIFALVKAEVEELNAGVADLTTFEKVSSLEVETPPTFWEKYGYFIAACLFAALMICIWYFVIIRHTNPRFEPLKIYITTEPSGVLTACSDSAKLGDQGTQGRVQEGTFDNNSDTLLTAFGKYTLLRGGCVRFEARDTVGSDSVRFLIRYLELGMAGDGATHGTYYPRTVDIYTEIKPTAETEIIKLTNLAYRFTAHDPPFNHDDLIKRLAFQPADGFQGFLARWADWLKAGFLLAFAGFLYWLIKWRARRRQKLVAQRDKSAKPPYVWNIRIKDLNPPDPGEAFSLTINSLRRRSDGETSLIDIPASVRATIKKGGMAAFLFRQLTHPPEYLMLVDRQNTHDHRARLYDDLYRILLQNEVLTERFFFDGDLRLCHNEQYPEGLSPDELLLRFPTHRLLIIGTGRQLLSASTGKLAKWAEQFTRWKDRALLSPLSASDWGRRERDLAETFRFAPATMPGLKRLIEAFEAEEELRTPPFEKLALLAIGEPVLLEGGDLLQTLEKQFPDALTRTWLAACALWPELHYDLTLWLGHWLAQESGQPVATMTRLGDLLRLPWFASGEMPDPVRAMLIDWLRETNPDLENRLRTALHALLQDNAPPEDSAAWDDFAMRVAFNEWLITTDPKTKKALEDKIAEWIEKNGNPDFIVIRELRGKPGPFDSILPDSWKKQLYKGRMRGLGLREVWKNMLLVALPLLVAFGVGLWWWQPNVPGCSGELESRVIVGVDTLSICVNSDIDRLLLWEYRIRAVAQAGDTMTRSEFDQRMTFGQIQEMLTNGIQEHDLRKRGLAWYYWAGYDETNGLIDTAFQYLARSASLFENARDTFGYYRARMKLADMLATKGFVDEARSIQKDANEYFLKSGNSSLQTHAMAYNVWRMNFPIYKGSDTDIIRMALECRANAANAAYNAGVSFSTIYDSLPDNQKSASVWKRSACFWFESAMQTDTSLRWVRQAANWCDNASLKVSSDTQATTIKPRAGSMLRLSAYPEVDKEITFILIKPDPGVRYELQVENALNRKTFVNGTLQHTFTKSGATTVNLYGIQNGRSVLLEKRAMVVARTLGSNIPVFDDVDTGQAVALPEMIPIKGGTFTMGSPESEADRSDDEKQHPVTLSDFDMSRTEVTLAQFKSFIDATKYKTDADKEGSSYVLTEAGYEKKKGVNWRCDASGKQRSESAFNHPVIHVSWNDASAYCNWLSNISGKRYRLPTEAEWEYAARGGQKSGGTVYAGSNDIDLVAWYTNNTNDSGTRLVASKKANELGLYDMSGNVWEWCADWYGDYDDSGKAILNPKGPATGSSRVFRGGSWTYDAQYCRVALRNFNSPVYRYYFIGFRLASSPQ